MLSAKYHLAYWAAALSAAAMHVFLLPVPGIILAQQLFLLPLAVYLLYTAKDWSFREKPTDWQLYTHQAAVAHFLDALGSVVGYYKVQGGGPTPTFLLHVLLAFTAVGTLESLRQNVCQVLYPRCSTLSLLTTMFQTNEIEPRSFCGLVSMGL